MPPSPTSPHFLPVSSHLSPIFHFRFVFSTMSLLFSPLTLLQSGACCVCVFFCVCAWVRVSVVLLPDGVDSPVWKEAFIGAQSSALNEDNGIQMCPST